MAFRKRDLISAGEEIEQIPVELSYQIIKHFSAGLYTSPNKAVEELVANSYDAWATHVHIILPDNLSTSDTTVWVVDDGESMNVAGFKDLWQIGRSRKREPTRESKDRPPIGKFGIGKLATYVLATNLTYICKSKGKFRAVTMNYNKVNISEEKPTEVNLEEKLNRLRRVSRELAPDGIFLQFMRYPGFWENWTWQPDYRFTEADCFCFCDRCQLLFARDMCLSLPPGTIAEQAIVILTEHRAVWNAWRQARIAEIVARARQAVIQHAPTIMLNTLPFPSSDFDGQNVRAEFAAQELGLLAQSVDRFELMTYRYDQARASQPHDHGDSWAIYAQVREYTEMTEWDRVDDGSDPNRAQLKARSRYRLNPGQAGVYFGRELHSTSTPVNVRYLRITGTDLETIERLRIDAASGRIQRIFGRQTGAAVAR